MVQGDNALKQVTLVDFRGGYCSSIAPELMSDKELLIAQNCYWDSGLRKRKGTESWDAIWGTATSIVGGMRAYMAQGFTGSGFYDLLAMDNGASVTFYHTQSSVTATLLAAYSFTTGYNVEFDVLDGAVLAVNGVNKPAVMYCTATWEIMDLEVFDKRERGTATWWAGQWYDTASVTASIWTSDTDDAQSSATSDFRLYDGSSSNGFWIACNYTFNKINLYNSEQVSGTYGAAYEYWNASSTWAACSLISSANFGAATATRTVEFNWPSDWAYGDSYFTGLDDLANHFIFRCRLSTGPSASFFCGSVVLEHTQYLTQVMDNDRPQAVAIHNRRAHLAAGNNVYLSQYAEPGGYELKYAEYFLDGGKEISQMVPYQDYLIVLKENALYGFYGNSLDTWVRKRLYHGAGAISRRSAAQVKNNLYWVARDGIYQWDGVNVNKVSRHIQSNFDSWVATTSVGIEYNGEYWVSFPSSTVTLRCDPDTFRTDDTGEGRISWFKNTLGFTQFLYNRDRGDDGYLYGAVACTATGVGGNHLCRLEMGHTGKDVWCGSTTAIDMIMQTGYKAHDSWGRQHYYTRILPRISQVSASVGATCTHALMSNNSSVTVSITQVLNTGTRYDQEYYSIPYTLDGKNLSYYFRHNATQTVRLHGITFEAAGRYL